MFSSIELTKSDLECILLWHNRAFQKDYDSTQPDNNTLIKLQAMIIIEQEEKDDDLFSGFRRRRR